MNEVLERSRICFILRSFTAKTAMSIERSEMAAHGRSVCEGKICLLDIGNHGRLHCIVLRENDYQIPKGYLA